MNTEHLDTRLGIAWATQKLIMSQACRASLMGAEAHVTVAMTKTSVISISTTVSSKAVRACSGW